MNDAAGRPTTDLDAAAVRGDSDPTTPDPTPDAIVIGAGSGGLTVAVGLSRFGRTVRLVEGHQVGGDCTNVGCIPSKTLLHATAQPSGRSGSSILDHVRSRRDHLREEETEEFGNLDGIDLQFGRARVLDAHRVEVTSAEGSTEVVEAGHVIVATGSRPRRLEIPGLPDELALTNEEIFELDDPPATLVVLGAGPVGLEMATAFARLGSRVVVLDAAQQILPTMLPEAAAVVHRSLEAKGIELHPGLVAKTFDPATSTLHIGPIDGGAVDAIAGVDAVLVAVGRVPNSQNLGLEGLGVEMDGGRIVIDEKGRSSVDGIWATGDVSNRGATTHAANAWGRRIVKSIVVPVAPAGPAPLHPAVTFTDPEAATIGVQPVDVPGDVRRVTVDLSAIDRAFTDDVAEGILIVDVRRFSGRILGATIVGPRAGELISVFALAMKNKLRFQKFYGVVWPYPSYADGLNRAVDDFMVEHLRQLPRDAVRWAVGRIRRSS